MELIQLSEVVWEIPRHKGMLVPGRIFATVALMDSVRRDRATDQVANVAHLPGIVDASFAMPDIHWGYGFPIGGVAATTVDDGVISPGGVGFDICCGVRLISSRFTEEDFRSRRDDIMAELDRRVPRGLGPGAVAPASLISAVLRDGAAAALADGYGWDGDLDRCEERGTSIGADPTAITKKRSSAAKANLDHSAGATTFWKCRWSTRFKTMLRRRHLASSRTWSL